MKKTTLVSALLATSTTAVGLFIGITVFDPANWAEAINQLKQLEKQYQQMAQTYNQITNQYNHMLLMGRQVPVNMAARYRALLTPWRTSGATNTYATTGGWIGAINTGANVATGYLQAAEQLMAYGAALANVPADQLDRVKKNYATVELTDGANQHAMETIGTLRRNSRQVETAIQGLEDDSLSSDPNVNTQVAVLNKINAASIIGLRNTQDTNKVLVALAEHQAVDAKRQRDAEARAINQHIRFMAGEQALLAAQKANASAAMTAFRMP
jgi:hypothetical protein